MIKFYTLLCLLTFFQFGYAQSDYLITESNDTIYGSVKHNFSWFGNKISVKNDAGKQVFRYKEMKAYQKKGIKFMKVRREVKPNKFNTWHCRVIVDGKLSLLMETIAESPSCFLLYEDQFFLINRRYFPNEVWTKLLECEQFAKEFSHLHKPTGGRLIVYPKHPKKWARMTISYNRCFSESSNSLVGFN